MRNNQNMNQSRRRFLRSTLATTSAAALCSGGSVSLAAENRSQASADAFREKLLQGLGGPWPAARDLNVRLRDTIKRDGFTIESLYYQTDPDDQVPALLLIPDGASSRRPAPAVVSLHQHQFQFGKREPAGLDGAPMHHTGAALAREGYVVLCPDMLCFGERRDEILKNGDYERFEFLRYLVNGKMPCLEEYSRHPARRRSARCSERSPVGSDRLLRPLDGFDQYLHGWPLGTTI